MSFTHLLRLVSDRDGDKLRGFSKDPDWPGWIPLQSYGPQNLPIVTASLGGSGRAAERAASQGGEFRFSAKPQDLDFSALQQWSLRGEPVTATLNAVPAVVGKEGYQLVFAGALVSYFSLNAAVVEFSLNFDSMQRRYLMRYR